MKRFTVILMALITALSCAACSSTGKNSSGGNSANNSSTASDTKKDNSNKDDSKKNDSKTEVSTSAADIEKKIADAVGKDNYLCDTDIDKDTMAGYYGLDMSKVDSYAAKQNSVSSVNPDTVIVIKVKDGYAGKAVEALNAAFSQQVDYVRQYPFGTQKVMNARIYQSGNYVMYILAGASYDGEDSEAEAKLAKSEYEKIDKALAGIFGELPANSAIVPKESDKKDSDNADGSDDNGGDGGLILGG